MSEKKEEHKFLGATYKQSLVIGFFFIATNSFITAYNLYSSFSIKEIMKLTDTQISDLNTWYIHYPIIFLSLLFTGNYFQDYFKNSRFPYFFKFTSTLLFVLLLNIILDNFFLIMLYYNF